MFRLRTYSPLLPISTLLLLFGCGGDASPTDTEENQAPTVTLSASPTSGFAPLPVSLRVDCSDSDGLVLLYELDSDGDGNYDVTRSAPFVVQRTFHDTTTVRARCRDDEAASSAVATQTIQVQPRPPPTAPTGLSASAVSTSQIDLSWTDNSTDETAFHIERSPSGSGSWTEIATVGANTTAYSDTGLPASTGYDYRVRANGPGGYSAYSDTASATTHDLLPTTDFYVSKVGDNANIGSMASPWRAVQYAIDQSPAGAVIHIASGTYIEQLLVSDSKTLVGAGAENTFIAKSGDGPVLYSTADLTLQDLSLTGLEDWFGGWAAHTVRRIVRVVGAHLAASRIGAYNYFNFGIVVEDGSFDLFDVDTGIDPTLASYTTAADISVQMIRSSGVIDGLVSGILPGETKGHLVDHQIRLEPGPGDTITVRNCTLFGYGKPVGQGYSDGIDIFSPNGGIPPTILIEDNTILGPLGGTEAASGVELNGGNAQITLRGNTIQRFRQGLKFGTYAGATALVEGNKFQDNTSYGIRIETESEVDIGGGALGSSGGNDFLSNAQYGIAALEQSGQTLIRTFYAKHNDWGTCDLAAIQARTLGNVLIDPPASCPGGGATKGMDTPGSHPDRPPLPGRQN